MPVTKLKARHIVDPKKTREIILKALEENDCNANRAAASLDCSYHTLWRLVQDDPVLGRQVEGLRKKLAKQGISQRGWVRPGR